MEGKWIGKYWFLGNVPNSLKGRKTEFELTIENYKDLKISGTVFDVLKTGGTSGVGKISGSIKEKKIRFVKRMPVKTTIFFNGDRVEENKPHRPIYYEGTINYESNTIEGTWRFKKGIGFLNGKLVIYPGTKGNWEMKKHNRQTSK